MVQISIGPACQRVGQDAIFVSSEYSIAACALEEFSVLVFGKKTISDSSYHEFMNFSLARTRALPPVKIAITYTAKETFNASQRRDCMEKMKPYMQGEQHHLVITESALSRAGLNSFSALMKLTKSKSRFHAVRPVDFKHGLEWADPGHTLEWPLVLGLLRELMTLLSYDSAMIQQLGGV